MTAQLAILMIGATSSGWQLRWIKTYVGIGSTCTVLAARVVFAAEQAHRKRLDVRCLGGAGSSGCSTVTSAAARRALHWRRLQPSLRNTYAYGGAVCATSAALAALAAQRSLLQ